MKKNLLSLAGVAAMALGLGACAYDPFYSGGGSSRSSVAVGYGYGHGYGGSSFTTSFFWSTGNPRWGYDPYARCYYDFTRRAYYDPYLLGYYPVGYRPPILVGVPHPHGYRQGWCPPPRRVNNITVVNYHNRESAYRNSNHGWARNVSYDSRHRVSNADDWSRVSDRNRHNRKNSQGRPSVAIDPVIRSNSANDSRNRFDGGNRSVGRHQDGNAWQNREAHRNAVNPPRQNHGARPQSDVPTPPTRQQFDRGHRTENRSSEATVRGGRSGFGGNVDRVRPQVSPPPVSTPAQNRGRFDNGRRAQPASPLMPSDTVNTPNRWQAGSEEGASSAGNWAGRGGDASGRGGRR